MTDDPLKPDLSGFLGAATNLNLTLTKHEQTKTCVNDGTRQIITITWLPQMDNNDSVTKYNLGFSGPRYGKCSHTIVFYNSLVSVTAETGALLPTLGSRFKFAEMTGALLQFQSKIQMLIQIK